MAESPTPPGALPTIKSGMRISFSLETLIGLLGGVIFCTTAYWKLDLLDKRVARIEAALGVSDVQRAPSDATSSISKTGVHP